MYEGGTCISYTYHISSKDTKSYPSLKNHPTMRSFILIALALTIAVQLSEQNPHGHHGVEDVEADRHRHRGVEDVEEDRRRGGHGVEDRRRRGHGVEDRRRGGHGMD